MLISLALIVVAVALVCALLFRLSVHALPLFAAFAAASLVQGRGHGLVAAIIAAALAGVATIAVAQIAFGLARSGSARAAIALMFALPAAFVGYHAVHGIALATMPGAGWQLTASLVGAAVVALASWTQWSRAGR